MSPKIILSLILGGLALFLFVSSAFRVQQVEQAVVLEFGRPVRTITEPGLHFKTPFIQNVEYFDKRLLEHDLDKKQVIMGDQEWLIVDAFVRYRITDPLKYLNVTQNNEARLQNLLDSIVDASLRQVLGSVTMDKIISKDRSTLMKKITTIVNSKTSGKPLPKNFTLSDVIEPTPNSAAASAEEVDEMVKEELERQLAKDLKGGFGVEVVDVRIMRADLPEENSEAVYRRMQTERLREAKELRAEGEEEAQKIRAIADNERTVLLSQAKRKALAIRGEGDAEATRISAEAYGRDPAFYQFYRSLEAYRNSMGGEDTTIVLSPESEFLRTFGNNPSR